ncbi:MAG: carbohydrate ABC transporter permease [Roseburia sp.]|nr:carbohydrate ABC transporter permease [Roseburia sp.]
MKKLRKRKLGDWVFDIIIYVILIALVIVTLYPMWYVIVLSFSNSTDITKYTGIVLWPERFTLGAYQMVFEHPTLMASFKNTILVLLGSLPLSIILTVLCGYFMASKGMLWKKAVVGLIMFTMFFSGGLIPGFLNIKSLGLYNTLWALIIPGCISVYNSIICKTAIETIPESLSESAYIDGANDIQVIFKIILPLIKPTLAVLTLYYGVARWNDWFQASIYIKDTNLLPIQNIIRAVLLENDIALNSAGVGDNFNTYAETLKYAAIVISTVPILCIYPFLQKYFTKGVMIGAVKG